MGQAQETQQEDQGDDAWDGITEEMRAEVLRRLDILKEYQSWGFNLIPGYPPDAEGWIPGHFDGKPCAFINVGNGPERGNYKECARPCPVRGERVH